MARKYLPGQVPGKDFAEEGDTYGLKVGVITRVDPHHMKADIKVLTGGGSETEVDLSQPMAGPRSFFGGVPEVHSMVLLGYRRKHKQAKEAVILAYLPVGTASGNRFDPYSTVDMSTVDPADMDDVSQVFGPTVRYKRIKGQPGDILGMSAAGSEMVLSKDVRFYNRAGDLFELRDSDRTLVTQAIHRVHSDSAVYEFSGGARRGAMDLPSWVFTKNVQGQPTRTLKSEKNRYFGRDELAALGPEKARFTNITTGAVLDRINSAEFPTVTYSDGRQAHYVTDSLAQQFEGLGGSGRVFTEHRTELRQDTDLRQPVLEEVDGFSPEPQPVFIEQVLGTVIGNDPYSAQGQRQYARVLKPKIFEDFDQAGKGKFSLEEALRAPGGPDEAFSMAGAYLFQMHPPNGGDIPFAVSVQKQGKLLVSLPGSRVENHGQKNISAEVQAEGALKMHLGASTPDRISLHLVMEGGVYVEMGSDAQGNSITTKYKGAVKNLYAGNSTDAVAHSHAVVGNSESAVTGNHVEVVQGSHTTKVDGASAVSAADIALRSLNSVSVSSQSYNAVISGKTQLNYAMQVQESIAVGGKLSTILLGADTKSVLAGSVSTTVVAGATSFSNPAGAFTVTVGVGALNISTGAGAVALSTGAGALSVSAGAGAVAISAGLMVNITAPIVSIVSPQILLGGPLAVFGVARGAPMLPPGAPSLDWITGLALQGCAVVRSI